MIQDALAALFVQAELLVATKVRPDTVTFNTAMSLGWGEATMQTGKGCIFLFEATHAEFAAYAFSVEGT